MTTFMLSCVPFTINGIVDFVSIVSIVSIDSIQMITTNDTNWDVSDDVSLEQFRYISSYAYVHMFISFKEYVKVDF